MTREIPNPLFERVFDTVDENGTAGTVTLQIGVPYAEVETRGILKWRCSHRVIGLGSDKIRDVAGVDSLDALLNSLRVAEVYLRTFSEIDRKRISWQYENWLGLSFPSPPEISEYDAGAEHFKGFQDIFDEFFRHHKPPSA